MAFTITNDKTGELYIGANAASSLNSFLQSNSGSWKRVAFTDITIKSTFNSVANSANRGAITFGRRNQAHEVSWSITAELEKNTTYGTANELLDLVLDQFMTQNTNAATTVAGSPSPTTSAFGLTSATNIVAGHLIAIELAADSSKEVRPILSFSGATATLAVPLPTAPAASDVIDNGVQWVFSDDMGVGNQNSLSIAYFTHDASDNVIEMQGVVGGVVQTVTFTVNNDGLVMKVDGIGYHGTWADQQALAAAIGSTSVTQITVDSAGGIGPFAEFVINSENLQCGDWQDGRWHIGNSTIAGLTRGSSSTTAATHSDNDVVRPAKPTASLQSNNGTIAYKDTRVRWYYNNGVARGTTSTTNSLDVSEAVVTITRSIEPYSKAGTASAVDRYSAGTDGIKMEWNLKGIMSVDDANLAFSQFQGFAMEQEAATMWIEAGIPKTQTSADGFVIFGAAVHILDFDLGARGPGGIQEVSIQGEASLATAAGTTAANFGSIAQL